MRRRMRFDGDDPDTDVRDRKRIRAAVGADVDELQPAVDFEDPNKRVYLIDFRKSGGVRNAKIQDLAFS